MTYQSHLVLYFLSDDCVWNPVCLSEDHRLSLQLSPHHYPESIENYNNILYHDWFGYMCINKGVKQTVCHYNQWKIIISVAFSQGPNSSTVSTHEYKQVRYWFVSGKWSSDKTISNCLSMSGYVILMHSGSKLIVTNPLTASQPRLNYNGMTV